MHQNVGQPSRLSEVQEVRSWGEPTWGFNAKKGPDQAMKYSGKGEGETQSARGGGGYFSHWRVGGQEIVQVDT